MHFDGKMKNNRRKIERGLGILPYVNSTTQTIGKCGGFRLCHDTGSACYDYFLPLQEGVADSKCG